MVVFFLGGGDIHVVYYFFFRWVGGGKYNGITYWYLISWVLNFVILALDSISQGFIFGISLGKYEKGL